MLVDAPEEDRTIINVIQKLLEPFKEAFTQLEEIDYNQVYADLDWPAGWGTTIELGVMINDTCTLEIWLTDKDYTNRGEDPEETTLYEKKYSLSNPKSIDLFNEELSEFLIEMLRKKKNDMVRKADVYSKAFDKFFKSTKGFVKKKTKKKRRK